MVQCRSVSETRWRAQRWRGSCECCYVAARATVTGTKIGPAESLYDVLRRLCGWQAASRARDEQAEAAVAFEAADRERRRSLSAHRRVSLT
jgi:hypothetical protein